MGRMARGARTTAAAVVVMVTLIGTAVSAAGDDAAEELPAAPAATITPDPGTDPEAGVVEGPADDVPLAPDAPPETAAAPLTPAEAYICPGYSGIQTWNPASQVVQDRFAWSTFSPRSVRAAGGAPGDIEWKRNPTGDPSWYMWLHSLRWLGSVIESGRTGDMAHLGHAAAVARDWVRDNPYPWAGHVAAYEATSHRANTLICLRHAVTANTGGTLPASYAWLDTALFEHGHHLVRHYDYPGNHATQQSMALLGVGCVIGRRDHADLAVQRFVQQASVAIDPEGATNEQSVGYSVYLYDLWGAVQSALTRCGYGSVPVIDQRRSGLATFLAHATTPSGHGVPIGDSETTRMPSYPGTPTEYAASQGRYGTPPSSRVGIYPTGGYVFGRSGWGTTRPYTQESHYSIRFGPSRALHGHYDRPAVTFFARGRDILVDTGHHGYANDVWRAYQLSPEAHSQLVVPTARLRNVPTTMTRSLVSDSAKMDFFEFRDTAYEGVTRTRGVLVLRDPDIMVVLDRATSSRTQTYRQLWQLPADHLATVSGRSLAIASRPGADITTTYIFQVPYGGALPRGATQAVRGQSGPLQGWRFPALYYKQKAPTVINSRVGTSASILTVVAPVRTGRGVTYTMTPAGNGWTNLDLNVAGQKVRVRISGGGYLGRG